MFRKPPFAAFAVCALILTLGQTDAKCNKNRSQSTALVTRQTV